MTSTSETTPQSNDIKNDNIAPAHLPVSLLKEAIREVRVASAERAESAADVAEVSRLKLEMLAEHLEDTFEESMRYEDLFDNAISTGKSPKLFIDAIAHVIMARDQKTYRLVRMSRQGRMILEESKELETVARAVTRYMAERIVERQTLLDQPQEINLANTQEVKAAPAPAVAQEGPWADFFLGLIWFAVGSVVGGTLLYLWATGYLDALFVAEAISPPTPDVAQQN